MAVKVGNGRTTVRVRRGWLGSGLPKQMLLASIYFLRALLIAAFLLIPVSEVTAYAFAAGMGLLWLSTVPPTSGLVALMFGIRHFGMLFGIVFFSHQVGAFFGVWLGGVLFERTGSYDIVWWLGLLCLLVGGLLPIITRYMDHLTDTIRGIGFEFDERTS